MSQIHLAVIFCCFILLQTFQESFSYTNLGVSITDLESTDSDGFNAEAASWTVSTAWNGIVYQTLAHVAFPAMYVVGGPQSLGGMFTLSPGEYFQRIYTGISPHTMILFTATFWYFDQVWGNRVIVKLYFDGTIINTPSVVSINDFTMQSGGSDNTAGTGRDLGFNHVYAGVAHSGSTLTLRMISQQPLSFLSLSFGFRDINLLFSNYAGTVTTCHRSEETNTLANNQCPCAIGWAFDSLAGSCTSCSQGCGVCFGPEATQCLKCDFTTYFDGSKCIEPPDPDDKSDQENEEKVEGKESLVSTAGPIARDSARVMAILQLQGPGLFSIVGLSTMIQYIRYLKINYPTKLLRLFQTLNTSPISLPFDIKIPEALNNGLPNRELPAVFEYYKLNSSFLLNYWNTLVSLVTVLGLMIILLFLHFCSKTSKRINLLANKLLKILKWNLFLTYFCSSFGDAMFFGILDLQTLKLNYPLAILSFLLILAAFSGILFTIIKSFIITLSQRKGKSDVVKKYQDYEVLFDGCKDGSFFQLFYLTAFFLREILCGIIITGLDGFPLLQAIMLVSLSLVMSAYSVFCRPLKNLFELIIIIINEFLLLVVNVCVLIYANLDRNKLTSEDARDTMAEIIIKISSIFCVSTIVFMAIQFVILLFGVYKKLKGYRAKGIISIREILKKVFEDFVSEEEKSQNPSLDRFSIPPARELNGNQPSQETVPTHSINTEQNFIEIRSEKIESQWCQASKRQKFNSNFATQRNHSHNISNSFFHQDSSNISGFEKSSNDQNTFDLSNCISDNNHSLFSIPKPVITNSDTIPKRVKRINIRPRKKNLEPTFRRQEGVLKFSTDDPTK